MPMGRVDMLDTCVSDVGYVLMSMMRSRLRVTTLAASCNAAWSIAPSTTNRFTAMDARLHTAYMFVSEYSVISAHRFDDRIVPMFMWLHFRFTWSLYST